MNDDVLDADIRIHEHFVSQWGLEGLEGKASTARSTCVGVRQPHTSQARQALVEILALISSSTRADFKGPWGRDLVGVSSGKGSAAVPAAGVSPVFSSLNRDTRIFLGTFDSQPQGKQESPVFCMNLLVG